MITLYKKTKNDKEELAHVTTFIDSAKFAIKNINVSVNSYVEARNTLEKINIVELNKEVAEKVKKITQLRVDIDEVIIYKDIPSRSTIIKTTKNNVNN